MSRPRHDVKEVTKRGKRWIGTCRCSRYAVRLDSEHGARYAVQAHALIAKERLPSMQTLLRRGRKVAA